MLWAQGSPWRYENDKSNALVSYARGTGIDRVFGDKRWIECSSRRYVAEHRHTTERQYGPVERINEFIFTFRHWPEHGGDGACVGHRIPRQRYAERKHRDRYVWYR